MAGVCALLAFLMVRGYAARLQALDPGAPAAVVVAGRDLARGTVIDASMVRSWQLPSAYVPPGAVPPSRPLTGRVLVAGISEGEVLTESRLSSKAGGSVAGLVPDGLRAVLVPSRMPSGTVRPGDRVDVVAAAAGQGSFSQVVGYAVEVLRVVPAGASGTGGIIVAAPPDEAEAIAQASALADTVALAVLPAGEAGAVALPTSTPPPQV